jgi:hypothetical protein
VVTNVEDLEIEIASQVEKLEALKKKIAALKRESHLSDP